MPILCKKCGRLILDSRCNLCELETSLTGAIFKTILEGFGEFLKTEKKCNKCGITWNEISASGRLGCHHDYDVFKEELSMFLKKFHGTDTHLNRDV